MGSTLSANIALFLFAALLIGIFGVLMTGVAGELSERTGLGEAVMGALFLGGSTSLPEIATSVTAAVQNHPQLAVSNAVGSIAAQTAFLGIADMAYRKVNLEHAAASAENLMLGALLVTMLAIPVLATGVPTLAVFSVHPATLLLFMIYVFGMRLVSRTHKMPMWYPRRTRETKPEKQPSPGRRSGKLSRLWLQFFVYAGVVAVSGWMLARAGIAISAKTALSESFVGGVLTGISSSLPELVTAVSAVRIGALTLAVGNVLGGNAFDTLIVGVSDIAYREGSIYEALSLDQVFIIALAILLTGILLMGMLHREKHGIGNIGLESFLVIIFYIGAFTLLAFMA